MESGKESGQFKKLKWTLRPRLPGYPSKRWGHTAVIHEGRLLIYGGNHQGVVREGVFRVNCETLQGGSIEFTNPPQVRESHSCNIIKDNLYVFGGCINQELTNDLIQFRVAQPHPYWRRIQQKNPIPPRESHVSLAISHKHLLIYGGTTPSQTMLDDFWIFDIEAAVWQQVTDIKGTLQPKIGCTMTLVHGDIFVFGGEFGEGEESQFSNDFYRLHFQHQNYSDSPVPTLTITKLDVQGIRPSPRTGHCCVDYKGKLLLILGGEGVSAKTAPILYNDIWAFDIRTYTWSELAAENRTVFRPRSNFTANIFKNTVYIFGGFINLTNFKWTDEMVTLTLHENKHKAVAEIETKVQKTSSVCPTCKFQFMIQSQPVCLSYKTQLKLASDNLFYVSINNIMTTAKYIATPFQALGLFLATVGKLQGDNKKKVSIKLVQMLNRRDASVESVNGAVLARQQVNQLLEVSYLKIDILGLNSTNRTLQNLIFGYRLQQQVGYDFKNSLFRLGREILITYLFDNDALHCYLLCTRGIFRFNFTMQSFAFQLHQKGQYRILTQFINHHRIDISTITDGQMHIFVGQLFQSKGDNQLRMVEEGNDFQYAQQEEPTFSKYINQYFLQEIPVSLSINDRKIQLVSYEKCIKTKLNQEPVSNHFKKIRLLLNEQPNQFHSSSFVKLYFANRRVGLFNKYPFISGFLQLRDIHSLNITRTRCQSWQVRQALDRQIQIALVESKKRPSEVSTLLLQVELSRRE